MIFTGRQLLVGLIGLGTATASLVPVAARAGEPVGPCTRPAAAGGEWASYGHDPSNTRTQSAETTVTPQAAPALAPAWVFSTAAHGDPGAVNSTPVVAGGCVFTTSSAGGIYALDAATGAVVWHHSVPVKNPGIGGAIVGSPALSGDRVIVLISASGDGSTSGPYAIAFDRSTGAVDWTSPPVTTYQGAYTNASAEVFDGTVFFGFSPPEGDPGGQGGFALLDAATGRLLRVTQTISLADQKQGYAGGGIWSTPAYDPGSGYAFVGAGNPYSKTIEDPHTNAILKIGMDRNRGDFGQIVASYKGNVDQYAQALQTLAHTPACAATGSASFPLDDPVCAQLDLDFGAAPNLFRDANGRLLVGDLQKSGIYHVAVASDMTPAWTAPLGLSCQVCNAASTATAGQSVYAVGTPGGVLWGLAKSTGAPQWASPVADGVHYQSITTAAGVVYTVDGDGFFDAFDAASGKPLLRRPMAADTGNDTVNFTSSGVAVAEHTVFAAVGGGVEQPAASFGTVPSAPAATPGPPPVGGYVIAYRVAAAAALP